MLHNQVGLPLYVHRTGLAQVGGILQIARSNRLSKYQWFIYKLYRCNQHSIKVSSCHPQVKFQLTPGPAGCHPLPLAAAVHSVSTAAFAKPHRPRGSSPPGRNQSPRRTRSRQLPAQSSPESAAPSPPATIAEPCPPP